MSKTVKRLLAAALAIFVLVGLGAAGVTLAQGQTPSVTYDCAQDSFDVSGEDLFTNLKKLMPGDHAKQEIEIKIKNASALQGGTVKIYLYANNSNADFKKLVGAKEWVKLNVAFNGTDVTDKLAETERQPYDYSGDLNNLVYLGEYSSDSAVGYLDVALLIDRLADNTLRNLTAEVDWYFYAVKVPAPPPGGGDSGGTVVPDLNTETHFNYLIGYPDGTVHPERSITRAEAACIFYRLLTDERLAEIWSTEQYYPDVQPDAWYYMYISTLTNGGILAGYPDGTFQPNEPITRAEMATILSRFDTGFGKLKVNKTFSDIQNHWGQVYIEFAAERGYVVGYPDGTFRPNEPITRAETAAMINRCLHRNVDEKGLAGVTEFIDYPDNTPGKWYYYDIVEASNYHDYERSNRPVENQTYKAENWTKYKTPIDWEKIGREWIFYPTGNDKFVTH